MPGTQKQPCTTLISAAEFWSCAQVSGQGNWSDKNPVQEALTSPFHKLQIGTYTKRAEPLPCPVLTTVSSIWSTNNWKREQQQETESVPSSPAVLFHHKVHELTSLSTALFQVFKQTKNGKKIPHAQDELPFPAQKSPSVTQGLLQPGCLDRCTAERQAGLSLLICCSPTHSQYTVLSTEPLPSSEGKGPTLSLEMGQKKWMKHTRLFTEK